ncbi:unnamed protein product [Ectocarpus sp. 12 AP-2014]
MRFSDYQEERPSTVIITAHVHTHQSGEGTVFVLQLSVRSTGGQRSMMPEAQSRGSVQAKGSSNGSPVGSTPWSRRKDPASSLLPAAVLALPHRTQSS